METELQFFMTEKDQKAFFGFVEEFVDSIAQADESQTYVFNIDDCSLIFTPSPQDKNILYAGKLNIKTDDCKKEERTKKVYRKLRNWLKKTYWSRLAYLNENKNNKLTPSRAYWVGPDAKRWKDEDPENNIFKLSATSWMVFNIGI